MDLYSMIEAGGNIKVEVSAADLCQCADKLIEKAQLMKEHELMRQEQAADEEKWLSTEEACKMCGVCTTTLWAWDKAGYLRAAKVGRRKRYALSDIKRLLSQRSDQCEADPISWKALRQGK